MSQGPAGLGKGALRDASAALAIHNTATGSVSASARSFTRLILVFMFVAFTVLAVYQLFDGDQHLCKGMRGEAVGEGIALELNVLGGDCHGPPVPGIG
jgi:hypothetical protein